MKNFSCLSLLMLFGLAFAHPSSAVSPTCTLPERLLSWPAVDPIWELCYLGAADSVGPRGSGLELRNVYLHGKLVLKKAHAPMLFADYTSGTCYRDWMDTPVSFLAMPAVRNQLGISTTFSTTTSCDRSDQPVQSFGQCPFQVAGRVSGDCFSGVAIEDRAAAGPLPAHVVLTTQYSAAWYFYSSRFYLYADGSFEPEFGFGNRDGTNNNITHWHNNYWRLDFDIEGADNDVIAQNDVVQTAEFSSIRCNAGTAVPCAVERNWSVVDTVTGRGFRLMPTAEDYITPVNQSGHGYHFTDVMGTTHIVNEYSDTPGSATLSDCGMDEENLVNGGDLDGAAGVGTDVVLYYRVGVKDRTNEGAGTQDSMVCKKAGPVFTPIGNWSGAVVLPDNVFADSFE
jgi:hypothetical protein